MCVCVYGVYVVVCGKTCDTAEHVGNLGASMAHEIRDFFIEMALAW